MWLVPGSWVRWGKGDEGADPGADSGSRWVPFSALNPLEVVDVSSIEEPAASPTAADAPTEPVAVPVAAVPPTSSEIDALFDRTSAAGPPAASALRSGGEGSAPDPSRPPVPLAFRWPEYPAGVERAAGPVTVEIRVWVEADGSTGATEVAKASGIEALDRKAREVAAGIRFEPATRNGSPVGSWYRLPITFHP
jgi:protein TonB